MTIRKMLMMTALTTAAASTVWAEGPKVEISGTAGWTFSDGVTGGPIKITGVGTFERIDPNNSFSWGARLGFHVTNALEVGGLFNQQPTNIHVLGTSVVKVGDVSVRNYHGYVAYNFGDAKLRPYLFGGAGITQFGSITTVNSKTVNGDSRFSTTWGLGAKFFPGKTFGIRIEGRWTPTYIKSDAAGWWCDPYWGCYLLSDAQYSNQFEMAGGFILRF